MINVGTAIGYLDLDTSKFEKGLSTALTDLKDFASGSEGALTSLQSLGTGMTAMGRTMTTTFTLPLATAGAASIRFASNFETSLSKVKAISGATSDEMGLLKDKALEMGAQTKFSASEAADAMTYMAMAGWDTQEMLDGISGIMDLAAASGQDLATTSDIVTDALTAFGLEASDSAHFADVLAQASSSANTNVYMLGESFKYVAPVAGSLGYNVEDISVALGLMANSGIKAGQAGTSLRAAMTRMVNPTDEAAAAMERYGISLTNEDGTMKSFAEVMDNLRVGLGGLTEAEQTQAAAAIFGQEAMSGMLAIVNASEEDYNDLTAAIADSEGAAKSMAETMMDNLSGSFEEMMGALETLAIKIGDILTPIIRDIVDNLTAFIDKLSQMSDEELKAIIQVAAVIAAIGPMLTILGKLITTGVNVVKSFQAISGVVKALSTALAGVSATVAAVVAIVVALVAAFATLWQNNEQFRNSIIAIWEEIKLSFEEFANGFVERINALGFDFQSFGELLSAIWTEFTELLAPVFIFAFDIISNGLSKVLDVILGLLDVFIGIFTGNWDQAWQGVVEIFSSLWNGLVEGLKIGFNAIVGVTSEVLSWFGTTWEGVWTSISIFFSNIWNGIISFFTSIINGIENSVTSFASSVVTTISNLPNTIWEFITSIPGKISDVASDMLSAGEDIMNSLWDGIEGIWEDLEAWFEDTFGWLIDLIDDIEAGIGDIMEYTGSTTSAGSHANGLSYVPYDGYVATLHKGERVLTANEATEYNKGSGGNRFDITFVTPKAVDEAEAERRFREVIRRLDEGFEV